LRSTLQQIRKFGISLILDFPIRYDVEPLF
jgi:hypothetical protein